LTCIDDVVRRIKIPEQSPGSEWNFSLLNNAQRTMKAKESMKTKVAEREDVEVDEGVDG
jgi:hypothetical protein